MNLFIIKMGDKHLKYGNVSEDKLENKRGY